jgi:alpha-N-acetylglucosamine transferase
MLIEPSNIEFSRIQKQIELAPKYYNDMEIINSLYHASALLLPHRKYALVSGEFRSDTHTVYLGSGTENWDPATVYSEAKLVRFSDWPLPKPWLPIPESQRIELQPKCHILPGGGEDCTARSIWNGFYTDFKKKREEVCR